MPHPDTIRLILVITSFVFLLGMIRKPFYGVISYLIIMMARPGDFYPVLGSMRIELLVGILIIIIMLLNFSRLQRIGFSGNPINKWMFLLYGVMLISMVQAFDFKTSWDWMIEFSKVFIFFLMIVTLIDTQKDVEVFLWIFAILTCFMAYDAIYNYTHGIIVESSGGGRIDYAVTSGGMGAGHVALANLTLQGMPFLWYVGVCNRKKILKLVGVILFLICLYGVIISGSRGGFVGLIGLFICLTIFSKHKLLMIGLGILLVFSLPIITGANYMDYMNKMLSFEILNADLSAGSRATGLRHGIEMLIKRPILGVGPGCYPVARKAWFGWGLWAHNHYGELMGDLGIIGTFVWFAFLYNYLRKSIQLRKLFQDETPQTAILTAVMVSTIVRLILGMGTHSVYIFFWYMVAGIVIVQARLLKDKNHQNIKDSNS